MPNRNTAVIKVTIVPDGIKKFDFETLKKVMALAGQQVSMLAYEDIISSDREILGLGYKIRINVVGLKGIKL